MRVAVFGATGVFGSRLARLLARDGHELILVARRGADALAGELGATSLRLDRREDLSPVFALEPDVVVDAVGPFQAYTADDLALAHAALAARVHYLDLSDAGGFCEQISQLDNEARGASIVMLTGASTVPQISGAAASALSPDMSEVARIESALLPGNRAPRGKAVMEAILAQIGAPLRLWQGGAWRDAVGWSEPRQYLLPGGLKRRAWLIGAPDLTLFPQAFGAQSVEFRAGLELSVMGWGLDLVSRIKRRVPFRIPLALAYWGAGLLAPFGTDRGGMIVEVTGRTAQAWQRRRWTLFACDGDGPSVPAIPARVLIGKLDRLAPGARSAVHDASLEELEAGMSDLKIRFSRSESAFEPLFEQALGQEFAKLAPRVQQSHQTLAATQMHGTARVSRGKGFWPNLIARVFGFPPSGEDVDVRVLKQRIGGRELWLRSFGGAAFRSDLGLENGQMTERFGPFTFTIGLEVRDGRLHYPVTAGRLGPLKLPKFALPRSDAEEYQDESGGFRFDVALYAPLTGRFIVRYEGRLQQIEPADLAAAKAS